MPTIKDNKDSKKENKADFSVERELTDSTSVEVYGSCSVENGKVRCRVGGVKFTVKK